MPRLGLDLCWYLERSISKDLISLAVMKVMMFFTYMMDLRRLTHLSKVWPGPFVGRENQWEVMCQQGIPLLSDSNQTFGILMMVLSCSSHHSIQDPALDLSTVVMAVSVYLVATNVTTTASVGSPLMSVR